MESARDTILIVDDQEINRAVLRNIFENTYNVLEAENGEQALLLIDQFHNRLAVILLDVIMPLMDGYQVMEEAAGRGFLKEVPVVIITAESSAESEVRAFDLGASDIIVKPFEPHVVKRRVRNIVDLNLRKLHQDELIEQQSAKLRESNVVMIDALSSIIEYRSLETGQHIHRISLFTRALLEDVARSCPEFLLDDRRISIIASASSMHDIGKIAIPDAILNKPGRLTPEEYEVMKTHAAKGSEMLTTLQRMGDQDYLRYAYNICRYHHERWDGRGYPEGLRGDAIPLCAQVVGIADCYDALTNARVYKKAIPPVEAINMILNGECGAFSPRLLESLKNVRSTFAQLTAEYIDTAPTGESCPVPQQTADPPAAVTDTHQMAQFKYFTLLRLLDATVMEVDFSTGIYHLVYFSGDGFNLLRSGAIFEKSYRNFVERAVHPDDRHQVLDDLDAYVSSTFDAGLMKRTRRYRVYSDVARQYVWYRATLMRIDTEVPHQRKALVVWQQDSGKIAAPRPEALETASHRLLESVIGSVLCCRNDRWLTLVPPLDGLVSLLGYTKEELSEQFQNRYLELIYPEDRPDVLHQLTQQLCRGDTVELEYRLRARDGRLIWVLDKSLCVTDQDGRESLYYVLIDITQSRQTQQELRLLSERYQILMEQTNDVVFEWDVARDILDISPNWKDRFGYPPLRENASEKLKLASHLHPDDLAQVLRAVDGIRRGVPCHELDVRIVDATGQYRWCRARNALQFGPDGQVLRVIGTLSGIDEEKRVEQALRSEAAQDSLTGLWDRKTAAKQIQERIEQDRTEGGAAVLLLDLDHFRQINERCGHLYGDEVLRGAAAEFGALSSKEGGLAARVGGDEFLIYLPGVRSEGAAAEQAERINRALNRRFADAMPDQRLSCCIGVSFVPADGIDFEKLFLCSDLALYRAKSGGCGRFEIYDPETMSGGFGVIGRPGGVAAQIDSEAR